MPPKTCLSKPSDRVCGPSACLVTIALMAIALLGGVAATAHGDPAPLKSSSPESESPDSELAAQITRLIEQLDAPTRRERVDAEQQLRSLGIGILPLLPPPELLPSAAVRDSVNRLRIGLEQKKARESVRPRQLTLQGRRSIADWLRQIEQQSGNRVSVTGLSEETLPQSVTLDLADTPFWKALDRLARDAKLRIATDSHGLLRLSPSDKTAAPLAVSTTGAFRVEALSARRHAGLAQLQIRVLPEPRLRPLFLSYAVRNLQATTTTGDMLPPFSPDAQYELPQGTAAPFQVDFRWPEGQTALDLNLKGTVTLTLAADSEPIRFTHLPDLVNTRQSGVLRRRGGVTVRLQRINLEATPEALKELKLRVLVSYDTGGPAFESHRTWILHNLVYLETAEGRRFDLNGGYETTLQEDGAVGLEYRFENVPGQLGDYRFVYVAPTLIIDVPIEFRLSEIPVTGTLPRAR